MKRESIVDQQVSIVTRNGERYDVHLTAAELSAFDASAARHYIGEAFNAAGLETPNPVGKILLIDQILLLAQERKTATWQQPDADTRRFLAAVIQSLGRNSVTIDLQAYKV